MPAKDAKPAAVSTSVAGSGVLVVGVP
jgi:hypothetical protein